MEKASQEKARQVERSSKLPARKRPERRGPERSGPERGLWPQTLRRAGCPRKNADPMQQEDWPNQFDWMVSTLEGFDKTFRARLKSLDVAEVQTWHESTREDMSYRRLKVAFAYGVTVVRGHTCASQFGRTLVKVVSLFPGRFVPVGACDVGPHVREHGVLKDSDWRTCSRG